MARRTEDMPIVTQGASALRREVSARNRLLAVTHEHDLTYGSEPAVVYRMSADGAHGNFFPASYKRMLARPEWARRLTKTYTMSHRIACGHEYERAELDCANSSDALLMNIFCHPRAMQSASLSSLLNIELRMQPRFGVRVRTPLRGGHEDRTEMDMVLGDLLVEAKLSESGFQTAGADLLTRYEAFEEIFDTGKLRARRGAFRGYQLLRGALAACHQQTRFAVFCDARRPDLREEWFTVLSAMRCADLRSRMLLFTWQEIAACVARPLQRFLADKYGIEATARL